MSSFLKTCSKCRKQKWNSEFYKNKKYSDGHKCWCKDCENSRTIQIIRKRKYGVTAEEYELILKAQNGVCAICGQPETVKGSSKEIKQLAIDHDHNYKNKKKIRGLLCHKCNLMLGNARDDIEILEAAIRYLKANQE